MRDEVIHCGISKDDKKSSRYFGGRYIVGYDKGGESDSEDGWMPNYYVPTNYFIDWSEWAVNRMKTLTVRQRDGTGLDRLCSRFQNADSYFVEGITFSMRGIYAPTFRVAGANPYDVMSSKLFLSEALGLSQSLGWLASKWGKFAMKNYLEHTVAFDVDALKEVPIPHQSIHAESIGKLVDQIIKMQRTNLRYDYASNEQLEIDRLVYAAYGFNEADIKEVETWYARRYPKLAAAARRKAAKA